MKDGKQRNVIPFYARRYRAGGRITRSDLLFNHVVYRLREIALRYAVVTVRDTRHRDDDHHVLTFNYFDQKAAFVAGAGDYWCGCRGYGGLA